MREQDRSGIIYFRRDPSRLGRLAVRIAAYSVSAILFAVVVIATPTASPAQVAIGVSVTFAPPALPVYVQPICPGPGYFWIPGYWAWDPVFGYYWVPGVWVIAPFIGALWTPGYWAWSDDGVFIWYEGYWGPVVGFYGGINYGFGYTGYGYNGGYWSGNTFFYNRTVNNINIRNVTTVYSKTVSNVRPTGVSFNGGPGGTTARPTAEQLSAARQRRSSLTDAQKKQMRVARDDPKQRATVNHGRPVIAATTKSGEFKGRGVISASRAGAPYKTPPLNRKAAPGERERVRTPKQGTEMHPSTTTPERITPKTPRKEPRVTEPRTAPERQRMERQRPGETVQPGPRRPVPQQPETTQPQPKEKTKGKEEEPR